MTHSEKNISLIYSVVTNYKTKTHVIITKIKKQNIATNSKAFSIPPPHFYSNYILTFPHRWYNSLCIPK